MQATWESFFLGKTKQNKKEAKNKPESKLGKRASKGRPETIRKGDKPNGKAKENVSTHHDALMGENPFHTQPV